MENRGIKGDIFKMQDEIRIILNTPISAEILQYIADCWVEFVTADLGYKPNELIMVLPDCA